MQRLSLSTAVVFLIAPVGLAQSNLPPAPSGVQVTTSYGIEFATVGSPGNAPHPGNLPLPWTYPDAFGSVNHEYRMARTEVTTGQWMQFVNTFSTQANFPTQLFGDPSFTAETPLEWAAAPDPNYNGPGVRYRLNSANAAQFPVQGITWRDAALYCNWLCNGQSSNPNALWNGAYDTSTFGFRVVNGQTDLTDQTTHNQGAAFWIPSYDEWAKAAWFDPNKGGPGVAGYWLYPTRSDHAPTYGPPGAGEADAGDTIGLYPVGSYPNSQSAWGMLDMAGVGAEWSEWWSPIGTAFVGQHERRGLLGSYAGLSEYGALQRDVVGGASSFYPTYPSLPYTTLRIASSVPCTGTGLVLACAFAPWGVRRRQTHAHNS